MILNFSIFDDQLNNLARKMSIPSRLDVRNYLSAEMINDITIKTSYELFAIVNCEGKTLQEAKYSSIVYRYDKDTEQSYWIKFRSMKRKSVSPQVAFHESKPHMLFYRLKQEDETLI